jgi:hypothetical protein
MNGDEIVLQKTTYDGDIGLGIDKEIGTFNHVKITSNESFDLESVEYREPDYEVTETINGTVIDTDAMEAAGYVYSDIGIETHFGTPINNLGDVGSGNVSGFNPDDKESQTFQFDDSLANREVTLNISALVKGSWDNQGGDTTDRFEIRVNGELLDEFNYELRSNNSRVEEDLEYKVYLDDNAQLEVEFNVASTASNEIVNIKNLVVTYEGREGWYKEETETITWTEKEIVDVYTDAELIMTTENYTEIEVQEVEVQVPFQDIRIIEETFTNTRLIEEEFEDTREVIETFTNTRIETEEFQDTKIVDGEDILGTRITDVIDSEAMENLGYTLVDDTWVIISEEEFLDYRTETETFTDTREIQVPFTDTRIVMEEFEDTREIEVLVQEAYNEEVINQTLIEARGLVEQDGVYYSVSTETETYTYIEDVPTEMTREVEVEFTDTRNVFTATTELVYETETYVIDENITTEEVTLTREIQVVDVEGHYETVIDTDTIELLGLTEQNDKYYQTVTSTETYAVENVVERTIEIEEIDIDAVLAQGYYLDGDDWYQTVQTTNVETRESDLLLDKSGYISYIESTNGDVDAFTVSATINNGGELAGRYARVLDLTNPETGDVEFSLAFDKTGGKIRGWNSENGEQVTYDMSDELLDGEDHTVEWQVTGTSTSLTIDGTEVASINYSAPIEIAPLNVVEAPEGTYQFTGTITSTEFETYDTFSDETIDLLYEENIIIDYDSIVEHANTTDNSTVLQADAIQIDLDGILMSDGAVNTTFDEIASDFGLDTESNTVISENNTNSVFVDLDQQAAYGDAVREQLNTLLEETQSQIHIDL